VALVEFIRKDRQTINFSNQSPSLLATTATFQKKTKRKRKEREREREREREKQRERGLTALECLGCVGIRAHGACWR